MQQLTNVWSAGVQEICAGTDVPVILGNHCETTVNNVNKFVNTALRFSSKTFIILFSQQQVVCILSLSDACLG